MFVSKKELLEENERLKRRIEELEDKGRTITLPRNGQTVEVTFKRDEMIGTLTVGDESHPVYLAKMEAHQCGREYERYLGKPVFTPGRIVRKFVLIEA